MLEYPVESLSVLNIIQILALSLFESQDAALHTARHKPKSIVLLLLLVCLHD